MSEQQSEFLIEIASIFGFSPKRWSFITCLAQDIIRLGCDFDLKQVGQDVHINVRIYPTPYLQTIPVLKETHLRLMQNQIPFFKKMEAAGFLQFIPSSKELDPHKIIPQLHICSSDLDHAFFRYCRSLQSFPSVTRIGRKIRALIFDQGQRKPFLIGALELASSLYSLRCRDALFHWDSPKTKIIKEVGLKQIMDLTVCLSIPPYSFLAAGKLVAALSFSNPITSEYYRRYGNQLKAVVTTCASGIHCPIFNRINLRKGGLFRRIGQTAGYTTSIFSRGTVEAARALQTQKEAQDAFVDGAARTNRLMRNALRQCNLNPEPFMRLGIRKAVYLATLNDNAIPSLQSGNISSLHSSLSVCKVTDYWKKTYMQKRILNPVISTELSTFSPSSLALSKISFS